MQHINPRALLFLAATFVLAFPLSVAFAQKHKVVFKEGHWAPLTVKVTYRDGKTRTALLTGVGGLSLPFSEPFWHTHWIEGKGEGDAQVSIWLDTIKEIKVTSDKEFTVITKDGAERDLDIIPGREGLALANDDGGTDVVHIANCKKIEFLKPARKDKKDNAMFDHWKYSPFTGEKLPVED